MVEDQTHHARVAALSIAHGAALAKLLRAHGREGHAENIEAALNEFVEIIALEVGPQTLNQAMTWVSDEAYTDGDTVIEAAPRH